MIVSHATRLRIKIKIYTTTKEVNLYLYYYMVAVRETHPCQKDRNQITTGYS